MASLENAAIPTPWADATSESTFIPRQYKMIKSWRPWQTTILEMAKVSNSADIHAIVDFEGNTGKTVIARGMHLSGLGTDLIYLDVKMIMHQVMDLPTGKCYLIDIPRAMCIGGLPKEFYETVEILKSGFASYKGRKKTFNRPTIFVFMSIIPEVESISKNKWKIWHVENDVLRPGAPQPL